VKANVYSHNRLIGTTELQVGDKELRSVFGNLALTDPYYKELQKSIWQFWATKNPDYRIWPSLRLNVQLENGYFLYPLGGYSIEDRPEQPEATKKIEFAGLHKHVIEDYFLQETPRTFVEEPWDKISIAQKLAFEDELNKEIGLTSTPLLKLFGKGKPKHYLSEFEFSALCKCSNNDDVLFAVRKPKFEHQFAVIHLTWKGKKEESSFPEAEFYNDFDEFKYLRMYPDKAEWEY